MKKSIIPYLFSIIILLILISNIEINSLMNVNKYFFNKFTIYAILVSVFFYNIVAVYKLKLITTYSGFKTDFNKLFYYQIVNYILKYVFPFKLGEIVKIFTFSKITNLSLSISTSFLAFDKILSIFIIFTYLIYGFFVKEFAYNYKMEIIFFSFILIIIVFVSIIPFIKIILQRFIDKDIVNNLFVSLDRIILSNKIHIFLIIALFQLVDYIITYFVFISFGIKISLRIYFPIMTVIILGSMLPFTVAGFGIRESLFVFFFKDYADKSALFYSGFLLSLIGHFIPALTGVFFLPKILPFFKFSSELEKIKRYLKK